MADLKAQSVGLQGTGSVTAFQPLAALSICRHCTQVWVASLQQHTILSVPLEGKAVT